MQKSRSELTYLARSQKASISEDGKKRSNGYARGLTHGVLVRPRPATVRTGLTLFGGSGKVVGIPCRLVLSRDGDAER